MAEAVGLVAAALQFVALLKAAINVGLDVRNAPKEQQDLSREVGSLEPLLTQLQDRLRDNLSAGGIQQLTEPLKRFKLILEQMVDKLATANKPGMKGPKALVWMLWNKKEVYEVLKEMERFKALLNLGLTMDIWDVAQQQQKNHEQLFKAFTDATQSHHQEHDSIQNSVDDIAQFQRQSAIRAEREKIIDWLSPLNFFPRHEDVFSTRQEGTGEWLFGEEKFKDWIASTGGVLWGHGMPGAGKTVLSSITVDYLRTRFSDANVSVACAYLNHKETEAQSPANILAGLWRQIIFQKPISAGSPAQKLYLKHHEQHTRPSADEVYTVLRSALEECPKAYIVIDALDEYPEKEQHILLKYLGALGPTLNLMLTSRPHITPSTFFPSVQALEIHATEADVCQYIVEQIRASTRLSKHVQSRPELLQEIETTILSNADGMFLLAKLHIDSLTTKVTIKAVREALKNLPKDLEHTYNEAMARIDSQSEDERNIAYLALIWVANAKRPLSAAELQEAIAVEVGSKSLDPDEILDIALIVSVCAGLLILDIATGLVRLIHYTTQDYLNRIQDTKFPQAQTEIAQRCLTYLLFETFQSLPDSKDGVEALLEKHSLLLYAFWNGLLHAAGDPEEHLQHLIMEFIEQVSRWEVVLNAVQYRGGIEQIKHPWQYPHPSVSPSNFWLVALFNLEYIAKQILAHTEPIGDKEREGYLEMSSLFGYLNMVALLIEKGADIHAYGRYYGNALQTASYCGRELVVRLLIEKGADVNAPGGRYGDALQAASAGGHESLICLLIEKGADIHAQGGTYGNALQAASSRGHESLVSLLIKKGADVHACGGLHGNALQAASFGGHESLAHLLIEKGANVNTQGGIYGNALQAASYRGHESLVHLLIEKGADVHAHRGDYGNALQAASAGGHESVVCLLIEKGADIHAPHSQYYGNALQAASYEGHESLVCLLIEKGADINEQDGDFGNVLQAASQGGHELVVRLLIEKGADINAQGGKYGNALQAASCYGHESVVRLLIEQGADVNAPGGRYGNALQAASAEGYKSLICLLIEKGADINAQGGYYRNALQAASFRGHKSLVSLLIEKGADINSQGGEYGNALQAASYCGHESVVQLLIEKGTDINAQGGEYGNALQAASYRGHESLVRLLIEKGADVNAQGGLFGNALYAAAHGLHESIICLLIEKGADVT
ncbi:ankyrin repeat domain-containing protein [Mycena rebaudengoi]|nr:ankyrin repeat domain-containing protein [Mycena rebaudengoi]